MTHINTIGIYTVGIHSVIIRGTKAEAVQVHLGNNKKKHEKTYIYEKENENMDTVVLTHRESSY